MWSLQYQMLTTGFVLLVVLFRTVTSTLNSILGM